MQDVPTFEPHPFDGHLLKSAGPRRRIGEDLDDEPTDERIDPPDQIVTDEDDEGWDPDNRGDLPEE